MSLELVTDDVIPLKIGLQEYPIRALVLVYTLSSHSTKCRKRVMPLRTLGWLGPAACARLLVEAHRPFLERVSIEQIEALVLDLLEPDQIEAFLLESERDSAASDAATVEASELSDAEHLADVEAETEGSEGDASECDSDNACSEDDELSLSEAGFPEVEPEAEALTEKEIEHEIESSTEADSGDEELGSEADAMAVRPETAHAATLAIARQPFGSASPRAMNSRSWPPPAG